MAPMVEAFPPWQLGTRVNLTHEGKLRKDPVNLEKDCALKELKQFNCELKGPKEDPRSVIVCGPIMRLFRRCANGMTVETTAWEGVFDERSERAAAS